MQYIVRKLSESDISLKFIDTLSNLSSCEGLTLSRCLQVFNETRKNPSCNMFIAKDDDGVVGIATLLIEQKFIHNGGKVGHIEDVVTNAKHQNKGIASTIIKKLLEIAEAEGCYKVILDCSEKNFGFYERLGFVKKETGMRLDL